MTSSMYMSVYNDISSGNRTRYDIKAFNHLFSLFPVKKLKKQSLEMKKRKKSLRVKNASISLDINTAEAHKLITRL